MFGSKLTVEAKDARDFAKQFAGFGSEARGQLKEILQNEEGQERLVALCQEVADKCGYENVGGAGKLSKKATAGLFVLLCAVSVAMVTANGGKIGIFTASDLPFTDVVKFNIDHWTYMLGNFRDAIGFDPKTSAESILTSDITISAVIAIATKGAVDKIKNITFHGKANKKALEIANETVLNAESTSSAEYKEAKALLDGLTKNKEVAAEKIATGIEAIYKDLVKLEFDA